MRIAVRAALLLVALVVAGLAVPGGAAAQGRIVGRYGDWQIRCERQVGAPNEECALIQNVEAADRANVALTVLFIRTADGQAQILRVLAPLGVLLPSGLGLSIDDNEVGLAGFVRCLPSGCLAEVSLDAGLIERLQAGKNATFVIFLTPEEGIGIPISLNGFADGFKALENPPTETLQATAPGEPVETQTEPVAPDAPFETATFADPDADEDIRTELDRLLEDELFPYVAGGAGAILLLLLVIVVLVVRGGRGRREARVAPQAPAAAAASPRLAPQPPQRQVPRADKPAAPAGDGAAQAPAAPRPVRPAENRVPGPKPDAPRPGPRLDRPS
jgi:invasion protein IalB